MDAGLIGGIIGGTIGIIGGAIGAYASIKNTNGPLERAFMVKASIVAWIGIIIFLVLLLALPKPYSYLMWGVYGVLLPLGIITGNRKQTEIRERESGT
jgi:FtsH-binding integral membrane protein